MEEYRSINLIKGLEGLYWVSNLGNVKRVAYSNLSSHSTYREKHFEFPENRTRYNNISIGGKSFPVSKLVAIAFPEICGEWYEGCEVDHINTNTKDNRAENLKVVNSHSENMCNPLTRKHISESRKRYMQDNCKYLTLNKEYQRERKRDYLQKYREEHREQTNALRRAYYWRNKEKEVSV